MAEKLNDRDVVLAAELYEKVLPVVDDLDDRGNFNFSEVAYAMMEVVRRQVLENPTHAEAFKLYHLGYRLRDETHPYHKKWQNLYAMGEKLPISPDK